MSIKTGYADMQGKQVRVNKGVEGLGFRVPGGYRVCRDTAGRCKKQVVYMQTQVYATQ